MPYNKSGLISFKYIFDLTLFSILLQFPWYKCWLFYHCPKFPENQLIFSLYFPQLFGVSNFYWSVFKFRFLCVSHSTAECSSWLHFNHWIFQFCNFPLVLLSFIFFICFKTIHYTFFMVSALKCLLSNSNMGVISVLVFVVFSPWSWGCPGSWSKGWFSVVSWTCAVPHWDSRS